jgi:hypothetical protein
VSARGVLRIIEYGASSRLAFWFPGCKSSHHVKVIDDGQSPLWTFNGDYDRPTFSPSILVTGAKTVHDENGEWTGEWERDAAGKTIPSVCHSFVRDGKIQFLSDCTHSLAGQTVDLQRQERKAMIDFLICAAILAAVLGLGAIVCDLLDPRAEP